MKDKEEVQLVDMVLRIRNKLAEASDQKLPVPDIITEHLISHVDTILKALPPDLQLVLQSDQSSLNGEEKNAKEPLGSQPIVTTCEKNDENWFD